MKTALKNLSSALFAPRGAALYAGLAVVGTLLLREPVAPPVAVVPQAAPFLVSMSTLEGAQPQTAFSQDSLDGARRELAQASAAHRRARRAARLAAAKAKAKVSTTSSGVPAHFVLLNRNWRSVRNPANLSVQARRALERNRFIDSELAADFAAEATVTNGWQPELESVQAALEESVSAPNDYSDRKSTEAQMDVELALGLTFPDELPYRGLVGKIEPETFSTLRENFAQLKDKEFLSTLKEPKLVKASPRKKKVVAKAKAAPAPVKLAARGRVAPSQWTARTPQVSERPFLRESPAPSASVTPMRSLEPEIVSAAEPRLVERPAPAVTAQAPQSIDEDPDRAARVVEQAIQAPVTRPAPAPPVFATAVAPVTAAVGPTTLAQALPKARVVTESAVSTQKKEGVAATAATLNDAVKKAFDETPFETDLFGRVTVNDDVADWLTRERGHIELYLQPVGSRDPQGTRYLSYRFPQPEFRDKAAALKGRYILVAGFYRPEDVDGPYAEAKYPEEITAVTAREHLKFDIKKRDLKVVSHPSSSDRAHATIHLSFFEGASADYREPHEIPRVQVRVISDEAQYPNLVANDQGNLAIHAVPTHSDIAITVSADGYYPTSRSFHVSGGDVHLPVYLISKEKVATMNRALMGIRQAESAALLMGRVFDPETRNPLEGEKVVLVDHHIRAPLKGNAHSDNLPTLPAAYFSFFGDPDRTALTGFFSFFNVGAAFRYLTRPESDRRAYRLSMRPGHGYYVELGRGGMRTFRGRLTDPNLGSTLGNVVGARVTLVGDPTFETFSLPDGTFEIPHLDFPTGMIAIDVEAPKEHGAFYSMTRHTIAYNPRKTSTTQDLFIVQDRFVSQSFTSAFSTNFGPNPLVLDRNPATGNVVGGAYGSLLEKSPDCLRVELWSVDSGSKVDGSHGPFAFNGSAGNGGALCLTTAAPGFTFQYLPPGEYLMKWLDSSGKSMGGRIVHVGMGRDSIAVN